MIRVCVVCKKLPVCLPKWLSHFANEPESLLFHPILISIGVQFQILAFLTYMWWYLVILIWHTLWIIFSYACHLCIFFSEVSVKIFFKSGCLFSYSWALRVLCIFWITVPYHLSVCFANSFSLSVACLFILLTPFVLKPTESHLYVENLIQRRPLQSLSGFGSHLELPVLQVRGEAQECTPLKSLPSGYNQQCQ